MLHIAHRGCINRENTIQGILDAFQSFECVEIDVRYNSNRDIVLCHDREKRNDNHEHLRDLCSLKSPMNLMIDIKAFGIETARTLTRDVVKLITMYPQHKYKLCSFNENGVQELLDMRLCSRNYIFPYSYEIGVITTGVPVGLFGHLTDIDFISFNYDIVHEEILTHIQGRRKKIYAWVCNDNRVKHDMEHRYGVDGIIYDYTQT